MLEMRGAQMLWKKGEAVMRFTEEMINEDEKRWHARDVVTELGYCGNYMRDRKDMKNIDIRFYAYIMRKAYYMLKEQEEQKQKWLKQIADAQVAVCPTGNETEEGLAKRTGEWNGLQMAWDILAKGR